MASPGPQSRHDQWATSTSEFASSREAYPVSGGCGSFPNTPIPSDGAAPAGRPGSAGEIMQTSLLKHQVHRGQNICGIADSRR